MNNIINKIFNEDILIQLNEICDSIDISDNNERADEMMNILEDEGFIELGCGTNRLCVKHNDFPYAIKIALDDRGIKDNNAERVLSKQNELMNYVTTTYENNGLILLCERVKEVMKSEDYDFFKKQIMSIMKTLSPIYILYDIGPKSFRNWGFKEDAMGREIPLIIDYAYLTRIEMAEIKRCTKKEEDEICNGKLMYSEDFTDMICKRCGKHYSLSKVAGGNFVDPLIEEGYYVPGVTD